jgi:SAM-dependent methyltransferase
MQESVMPKPSNASDCSLPDRKSIAEFLYIGRGASDTSKRCQLNSELGSWDLMTELLRKLSLSEGQSLVDVGCGTGQHLARFAEEVGSRGRVLGIDLSSDAIARVWARGQVGIVGSASKLPLPDAILDALTCNYAIYYFEDIPGVLAEWSRVLRPGGRVVISGPASESNRELYDFHSAATGSSPTDADRMALGFVQDVVTPLMSPAGFEGVELEKFENRVTFPDLGTFLDYWSATSLFAMTPGATRQAGETWLRNSGREEFLVTKRVSVLSAKRKASGRLLPES